MQVIFENLFQTKVVCSLVVEVFSNSALAVAIKSGTTTAIAIPPARRMPVALINAFPAAVFGNDSHPPVRLLKFLKE